MAARKIIIQFGLKRKVFKVKSSTYDELISLIEYYGYDFCLKDHIFVYSNPRIFNIVDLNLSLEAIPQPPLDEGVIA